MDAQGQDFTRNAPLIGGRWLSATSLGKADHLNPANNRPQAELHIGGAAEIDQAVAAARQSHRAWAGLGGDAVHWLPADGCVRVHHQVCRLQDLCLKGGTGKRAGDHIHEMGGRHYPPIRQ